MTTRLLPEVCWPRLPINKHMWAFYYFMKRKGDRIRLVKHGDGTASLYVRRNDG